jgi:sulfite exporter TauE/SafE
MQIESSFAAFLAGLGTGAHCALMCGPLACAVRVRPLEYHATRLLAYTLAGTACGALGEWLLTLLQNGPAQFAPWALLTVFVAMACGWDKRIPVPAFVSRVATQARLNRNLGWFTPLLPCGPLWLMLGAAAAAGSAIAGGSLLLCFGFGTVALYGAIQGSILRVWSGVFPKGLRYAQSCLLWSAVLVLAWRVWMGSTRCCNVL